MQHICGGIGICDLAEHIKTRRTLCCQAIAFTRFQLPVLARSAHRGTCKSGSGICTVVEHCNDSTFAVSLGCAAGAQDQWHNYAACARPHSAMQGPVDSILTFLARARANAASSFWLLARHEDNGTNFWRFCRAYYYRDLFPIPYQ